MTQQEAIARLSRYQSPTPSTWHEQEEATRRAKTVGWLPYSRRIAVKTAPAMKRQNVLQ